MTLFEPFAWRDHAQPSRDGHLVLALLALLLQQQAQSQRALLDLRPAKRRRTCPRRPGARLIWSYNALFEDEFYPNYRMAKHKFAALV